MCGSRPRGHVAGKWRLWLPRAPPSGLGVGSPVKRPAGCVREQSDTEQHTWTGGRRLPVLCRPLEGADP